MAVPAPSRTRTPAAPSAVVVESSSAAPPAAAVAASVFAEGLVAVVLVVGFCVLTVPVEVGVDPDAEDWGAEGCAVEVGAGGASVAGGATVDAGGGTVTVFDVVEVGCAVPDGVAVTEVVGVVVSDPAVVDDGSVVVDDGSVVAVVHKLSGSAAVSIVRSTSESWPRARTAWALARRSWSVATAPEPEAVSASKAAAL